MNSISVNIGTVCAICVAASVWNMAVAHDDLRQAYVNGAQAKVCYRVVDDTGVPVGNATAHVTFKSDGRPQDNFSGCVVTDTNGVFIAEHRVNDKFSCIICKDGFYQSHVIRPFMDTSQNYVVDGKWYPYGEIQTVVLKKIRKPEVVGKQHIDQSIPVFGEWCGYDLEVADWISPHGHGKYNDVMIRFFAREVRPVDFGYKMEISFAHLPFAGSYLQRKDVFSELVCTYAASTNAIYEKYREFEVDRAGATRRIWNQLDDEHYIVFRTRTKVNDRGELVSAHYGRIDGKWKFHELHRMTIKGIYFNAASNDVNLEDQCSYNENILLNRICEQ